MDTKWILKKIANTAGVKILAALSLLLLTLAVTRLLSEGEAGTFLYGLSFLSFAIPFFSLGLEGAILKVFSSNDNEYFRSRVLTTGLIWIGIATIPFCLLISLLSFESFLGIRGLSISAVLYFVWCVPLGSACLMLSASFQSIHKVNSAIFLQNLGATLFFLILLGIVSLQGFQMTSTTAAGLYLISILIVSILAFLMIRRSLSKPIIVSIKNPTLWKSSSNLWAATAMSLIIQWGSILIAGFYVESIDFAHLSAAMRIAALTSFVLTIVNMVVAPRYAKLWAENNINEVQRMAKLSTRSMVLLVIPIVIMLWVFPVQIMNFFGEGYKNGAVLLIILTIGQFINVITGSVGYLLMMSGHEREYRNVVMISGPITIFLSYFFIVQWGVIGAAIATAVGLSLQNIGALFMVRKRLGFWPIG